MAHELKAAGTHILCIKDMGGLMKPATASVLFKALKEEVGLPLHFHTHDTAGIAGASILAASEAGVDAVVNDIDRQADLAGKELELFKSVESIKELVAKFEADRSQV